LLQIVTGRYISLQIVIILLQSETTWGNLNLSEAVFSHLVVSMKKYFLLIVLMAGVFLWFGGYATAITCPDNRTVCTSSQECSLIDSDLYECINKCEDWDIIVDDGFGNQVCCDVDCQQVREGLKWTECSSPKWWVWNGIRCSCPTGTKDVDGVCKPCSDPGVCCGIELNTSVPFIGNCIEDESSNDPTAIKTDEAFPVLMSSLTKILVTVILIVSFVLIIVWGIMIASGNPSWGKKMIIKVVMGIALLGASGVILRLINPNFFG